MKIVIGADHAGYGLKQALQEHLRAAGHAVEDVGTHGVQPVDYPDVAVAVGMAVREGRGERAILICGSGVGASIAANKLTGIRASVCHDLYSAHQGVEHDDMNVLVLGARVVGPALAEELVDAFLKAQFDRQERHLRRLAKVVALDHPSEMAGS